ncbi:hypothetical protein CEXT_269121 [Caerostris extrusa]|uniref:Uncharacterized protein n=1 Tax=Caerostris extrusa TaxID=172846 RepID=A0AAV4R856_CAEEX|nr:hypothetical protein CEXT_269121 [Caerostris extrusa]
MLSSDEKEQLSEISGIDQKSFFSTPDHPPVPLSCSNFRSFGTKENGERQAHVSHAGMTFYRKNGKAIFPIKERRFLRRHFSSSSRFCSFRHIPI